MNDSGIGDELVEPAERCDAGFDHAGDLFLGTDIDLIPDCAGADFCRCLLGRSAVDVRAAYRGAFGGQPLGDREADPGPGPGPGPGHDRGFAGQVRVPHGLARGREWRVCRPGGRTSLANGSEHHKAKSWHVVGEFDRIHPKIAQHPGHGLGHEVSGGLLVRGEQAACARRSRGPQV